MNLESTSTSRKYSVLEELTRRKASKNSKGVMINQIHNLVVEWTSIVVFIFLKNLEWPFNVKQKMLEAIKNVAYDDKRYNWVTHVANLVKSNCERCREAGGSIRFPSLLIWIAMTKTKISLVSKVSLTSTVPPTMKHFQCFALKAKLPARQLHKRCLTIGYSQWNQHATSGRCPKMFIGPPPKTLILN